MFQGVAQAAISANHGYLLIPGGPGASDVYRWLRLKSYSNYSFWPLNHESTYAYFYDSALEALHMIQFENP